MMSIIPSEVDVDLELLVKSELSLPQSDFPLDGLVGLDTIGRRLEHEISLLSPQSAGSLPSNSQCTHSGKVFSLGIMKVLRRRSQ